LSGSYIYGSTGSVVTAYVIDTGILVYHSDFGGRTSVGLDEIGDGRNGIDCNGQFGRQAALVELWLLPGSVRTGC
jgi:subtilisin family serine protease